MNTGIKFIAVCTVYDCTAIGYITIVNLNPTTLQEKKTNVAEIDWKSEKIQFTDE